MIILVHSGTTDRTIQSNLGESEYSYFFVLKEFRPMLETFGVVVDIADPEKDVDRIYRNAAQHGETCIFLSFAPPHQTCLHLACPTIPVFAWEFDTLPSETWDHDVRNDWRTVLNHLGRAITHSRFAANLVRDSAGPRVAIGMLPAPVWDRFASMHRPLRSSALYPPIDIVVTGRVIDTGSTDLSPYGSAARRLHGRAALPGSPADRNLHSVLRVGGLVYTSVFNPFDGRKNWFDMIAAFCWALREESNATLILKLTHHNSSEALSAMLEDLAKLAPMRCRVILIDGYLSDQEYERLVGITTFAVNTSHGEGQCLPLMEFMSAGKPALSPVHTAMIDYVDETNGFAVRSTREPTHWPHDPRQALRTIRHRIDFQSLVDAYRESHAVASRDPDRYLAMSNAAHARLRAHCSQAVIAADFSVFLESALQRREPAWIEGLRLVSRADAGPAD